MDIELLTIEQVAERTGLSAHTLRYYERIGLLDPVSRATSGHRRYAAKDLAWIEFLTRLRATGMPIRQMQEFAALRRQGDSTVARRCALLEAHQQMVQTHIEKLQRNLEAISQKVEMYHQVEESYGNDSRYPAHNAGIGRLAEVDGQVGKHNERIQGKTV